MFVLTAGFELREPSSSDDGGASTLGRRMTEVEIFEAKTGGSLCSDTVITCSHFPDDGSYSTFLTGSHFSLTEGCTLDASAGDLLRHCADIFVALENEDDEAIEITYEDEETDDIAAAYEATMEIGTEAVAEDTPSNTDVGGSKVIAASYTNWKNSKHTFQQVRDMAKEARGERVKSSCGAKGHEERLNLPVFDLPRAGLLRRWDCRVRYNRSREEAQLGQCIHERKFHSIFYSTNRRVRGLRPSTLRLHLHCWNWKI